MKGNMNHLPMLLWRGIDIPERLDAIHGVNVDVHPEGLTEGLQVL